MLRILDMKQTTSDNTMTEQQWGREINLTAFVNRVCWHLKKWQRSHKTTEYVCRLLCHVSQTLWEHGHCWYFQLTAHSCFKVMSTVEATTQAAPLGFFWRRGKLQKITVCYPTPGLVVFFGSLVSCSKTWRVTLGIQLQLERPSLCRALWG